MKISYKEQPNKLSLFQFCLQVRLHSNCFTITILKKKCDEINLDFKFCIIIILGISF